MSDKKPVVIVESRARGNCPVCGKPAYSAAATHPQCAAARADALSRANLKKTAAKSSAAPKHKMWTKTCPKCKRVNPARRVVCDCGHQFGEPRT